MSPSCLDFDLCQDCEALPFPAHPPAHPLLKMKTADTLVPLVHKSLQMVSKATEVTDEVGRSLSYASTQQSPVDEGEEEARRLRLQTIRDALDQLAIFNTQTAPAMMPLEELETAKPESPLIRAFGEINVDEAESAKEETPATSLLHNFKIPSSGLLSPTNDEATVSLDRPSVRTLASIIKAKYPENQNTSVGQPVASSSESLIDLDEPSNSQNAQAGNSIPGGVMTPLEAGASTPSVPRLGPVNNEWRELWPELTTMLKHLLQPPTPNGVPNLTREEGMPGGMVVEESKMDESVQAKPEDEHPSAAVEGSTLGGEPLLCRPLGPRAGDRLENIRSNVQRVSDYFSASSASDSEEQSAERSVQASIGLQPLHATFVSDGNIPDGQIFPPGAEFVKSWRMANQGSRDWPESTELVFVAGDRMAPHGNSPRKVKVGAVKAGEEVEIVAGEMKVSSCLLFGEFCRS